MTGSHHPTNTPSARTAGEASGKHRGLRQPADDQQAEDAVDNVGQKDSSATLEDHLRDCRGKGVRGGYDDSIDHDADEGRISNEEVARSPRKT